MAFTAEAAISFAVCGSDGKSSGIDEKLVPQCMWRLVERELPNKHLTAHILRHTYITRLFEAGLDIKEVQYLAGHSTVDMTLRVYTHYDRQSREKQTIEKVREAFRKESA